MMPVPPFIKELWENVRVMQSTGKLPEYHRSYGLLLTNLHLLGPILRQTKRHKRALPHILASFSPLGCLLPPSGILLVLPSDINVVLQEVVQGARVLPAA